MIVKFKIFEKLNIYNEGDYVLVTSDYYGYYNEPMIIYDEVEEQTFAATVIKNKKVVEISGSEIIRKLTPLEIDTIKYNL